MTPRRSIALIMALLLVLVSVPAALAEIVERVDNGDGTYELYYFDTEEDWNMWDYSRYEYYEEEGVLRSSHEGTYVLVEGDDEFGEYVFVGTRKYFLDGELSTYRVQDTDGSKLYNMNGELLSYSVFQGEGNIVYTADGALRQIIYRGDAGNNVYYMHNDKGEVTQYFVYRQEETEDGDWFDVTEKYTPAGKLFASEKSWYIDGGWRTEYYDGDGKLLEYSLPANVEGVNRTNYYGADGVMKRWVDYKDGKTSTYDAAGNLQFYTLSKDTLGGGWIVEHYDAAGNLVKTEVYDANGRLMADAMKPKVKYTWYPSNTLSTFGLALRDVRPELTDKWYNVTPVDLSQDGTTAIELVAGNLYIVGKVLVTVKGDEVVVTYESRGMNNDTLRMESEFFTLFPNLDAITTVEPEEIGEGFKFGEAISIANDLEGNANQLLFVRNVATYRDHVNSTTKYTRLWPNQPHRKEMRQEMLNLIGE